MLNHVLNQTPVVAYAGASRNQVIDPLINRIMGVGVQTQPDFAIVRDELGYFSTDGVRPDNLVDRLLVSTDSPNSAAIAKAVCASVLGSAVTLLQ